MKKFSLVLILPALLLWQGCAVKPSAPVSPAEQVLADNAILATSNGAVATAVMKLQGAGLVSTATAAPILGEQYRIAQIDNQLTPLLTATPSKWDTTQILQLIQQINSTADNLVSHGLVGIRDPAQQQAITRNLDTITTIAGQMLQLVQSLKGA